MCLVDAKMLPARILDGDQRVFTSLPQKLLLPSPSCGRDFSILSLSPFSPFSPPRLTPHCPPRLPSASHPEASSRARDSGIGECARCAHPSASTVSAYLLYPCQLTTIDRESLPSLSQPVVRSSTPFRVSPESTSRRLSRSTQRPLWSIQKSSASCLTSFSTHNTGRVWPGCMCNRKGEWKYASIPDSYTKGWAGEIIQSILGSYLIKMHRTRTGTFAALIPSAQTLSSDESVHQNQHVLTRTLFRVQASRVGCPRQVILC